jgi:Flp pilus assembly pilin Flp
MLRLIKNKMGKRGQSIIEYALLITVVAAAFIAMQSYILQIVQGRLKQVEDELNEPIVVVP